MIAILDYGSGNIRSAERAFATTGNEVVVTNDPKISETAAGLVIPGVGAFAACMNGFLGVGGAEILKTRIKNGLPTLGICVGMQILFASSVENGLSDGLGLWPGQISAINHKILPHMGWNTVQTPGDSILFNGVESEDFYFVHSYAAKEVVPGAQNTFTEYGEKFLAAVETPLVSATQFHPEKSGESGLRLISNWCETL